MSIDPDSRRPDADVVISVTGVPSMGLHLGKIGIAADSHHADGREVQRLSPSGAISASRSRLDGSTEVRLHGRVDTGKESADRRVINVLVERLIGDGRVVSDEGRPGKDQGADWRLCIDERNVGVQITAVDPGGDFYRPRPADVPGRAAGDAKTVADWIYQAIDRKTSDKYDPAIVRGSILALDIEHLGVLALPDVLWVFRERFCGYAQHTGWAEIWLIGPTASTSARIDLVDGKF